MSRSKSYTFVGRAETSDFAGGALKVKTFPPGDEDRISFWKHGKEMWHAMVPTVHGRYGMLREFRFFAIAKDHLLVSADYEHPRGGHTDGMVSLCNARGICATTRIELGHRDLMVRHTGARAETLLVLDNSTMWQRRPPAWQLAESDFFLGTVLWVFDIAQQKPPRPIPLFAQRERLQQSFGVPVEPLDSSVFRYDVSWNETKSGTVFIEVTTPARISNGRLKLEVDELLGAPRRYDSWHPERF